MFKRFGYLPANFLMDEADAGDGTGKAAGSGAADDKSAGDGKQTAETKPSEQAGKAEGKTDDEKAELLKDMMKWKAKAREGQSELDKTAAELAQFKGALGDVSIDDLKGLINQKKEAERQEAEKKGEYERVVAQMKEENQKRLADIEEKSKAALAALAEKEQLIERLTVGTAFSDSAFIRESSVLPASIAQKEFGSYFEFEKGALVAYDKPKGSDNRTPLVNDMGEPKSFEEAISQLYAKHPDAKSLIRAKRKSGAGSDSEGAASGQKTTTQKVFGVARIAQGLGKSA